jgi:mannose-1-phosphate guanylyltransferase/mannose-6-phosphate isomerase
MKIILLAGGLGTRLWPLSTRKKPKQFLKLFNQKSTFELAVERALKLAHEEEIIIVTNKQFLSLVQEQLDGKKCSVLIENEPKNTMGAITLAVVYAKEKWSNQNDLFLVFCSDHLIDGPSFYKQIKEAKELAKNNIVLFGTRPTRIETGYGYIQTEHENVLSFKEKPNATQAKEYIEDGNYFWNLGMFFFSQKVFERHLFEHCKAHSILYQLGYSKLQEGFAKLPSISFDYAILEKAVQRKCIVFEDLFWSDVGSFDALYDLFQKDAQENAMSVNTNAIDSKGNLVIGKQMIFLVDCEELIVIEHEGNILVTKRRSGQKVKEIVKELSNS